MVWLWGAGHFDWTNNAKDKAGVTCSIIGIQTKRECIKHIYENGIKQVVKRINGYLVDFDELYIKKQTYPISKLPIMITGNSPYDGGNLMLTSHEKQKYLQTYPQIKNFIRRAVGADEFINGIERYCLWINDEDLEVAFEIPEIRNRIENVRQARMNGGDVAKSISSRPHQFRYTHTGLKPIIVVPIVSSSRRKYIPIGILPKDTIILSSAAAIYDGDPYVMGVISSRMHMVWVRRIAGKLRSDIRYLTGLCYNTFPFPEISNECKNDIKNIVFELIGEREKFSELTLAELYDPDKMPISLLRLHEKLDALIDSYYRKSRFESDEERLAYLFSFYQK